MGIKHALKHNSMAVRGYKHLRKILTFISPTLNTKVTYYIAKGKRINLENPETFEEKILWLKLNMYADNALVTKCADKYQVRSYVKEDCGLGELLNELIGAWDSVDGIDWELLPNKFALKCNHGSGYNIICDDKRKLDIKNAKMKLNKWISTDQWKSYSELNYKNINKKIICEKYLETDQGFFPYDYKIYCFNGVPKAVLVMMDRGKETKGVFMSPEWDFISNISKYEQVTDLPDKPYSLDIMIKAAIKLSRPFPFVRVDFYQYHDRAIFGEMTFTPAGGLYVSQTDINGVSMGELLDLSKYI
jgi:hypothetical protein